MTSNILHISYMFHLRVSKPFVELYIALVSFGIKVGEDVSKIDTHVAGAYRLCQVTSGPSKLHQQATR